MSTPIYDRLLAEFRSLHYGRDPGTERTSVEVVRDAAVAFGKVGSAAQKAGGIIAKQQAVMKESQRRGNQPRDPRKTTTTKRSRR